MTEREILGALQGGDAVRCEAVLLSIAEGRESLTEENLQAVVELLSAGRKSIRRRAAGALTAGLNAGLGEAALGSALRAPSATTRWGAVFASAEAGRTDDVTYAGALEALASEDGDVRWAAAEIVRRLSLTVDGRGERLAALVSAKSANARKMALYCLRDLGRIDESMLVKALKDEVVFVRLAALAAASRLGSSGPALRAQIVSLLAEDEEPGVQRAAAAVLGPLAGDDKDAVAALQLASQNADVSLARAARGALERAGEDEKGVAQE